MRRSQALDQTLENNKRLAFEFLKTSSNAIASEASANGCQFSHRVDGSDVESGYRLHKGQCWVQDLLRRASGFTPAGNGKSSISQRVYNHASRRFIGLPKRWREPRLIFVNSMSDLFHEEVPLEFIQRVFATMRACSQHTFQILTKRSGRLKMLAPKIDWPANVWIGVSVEDSRVLSLMMITESPCRCALSFLRTSYWFGRGNRF